jgi:hypothetical protein
MSALKNYQDTRNNNPTGIGLPIPLKEGPNQTINNSKFTKICLFIARCFAARSLPEADYFDIVICL